MYLALPLHKAKCVQLNGKTLQVLQNSLITQLSIVSFARIVSIINVALMNIDTKVILASFLNNCTANLIRGYMATHRVIADQK